MSLVEDAKFLIESIEHGCRNSDSKPDEVAAYRLAKAFLAGSGETATNAPPQIFEVSGKCGDLCAVTYPNGNEKDGYVPRDLGIGGGDYISVRIDINTGKVVGWCDKIRDRVLLMQSDSESLEGA